MVNVEVKKPKAKLVGANGNIFNLMGIASRSLKRAGQNDKATEMSERVMSSVPMMKPYLSLWNMWR